MPCHKLQAQLANRDALLCHRLDEQRKRRLDALREEHSRKEEKGNDQVCSPAFMPACTSLRTYSDSCVAAHASRLVVAELEPGIPTALTSHMLQEFAGTLQGVCGYSVTAL